MVYLLSGLSGWCLFIHPMLSFRLLPLLFISSWIGTSVGWNVEGHQIAFKFALQRTSQRGLEYLNIHLDMSDIDSVCMYADSIEWSEELHYSFTPYRDCQNFALARDCGRGKTAGRCIVSAIGNYTERAVDLSLSLENRSEAVKFIIHFAADIHQPFHTGFFEDGGATAIELLNHNGMSLHQLWDSVLPNRAMRSARDHHKSLSVSNVDAMVNKFAKKCENMTEREIGDLGGKIVTDGETNVNSVFTNYAAWMASETSTSVTCDSGYKDNGEWITAERALTADYKKHGAAVAANQLFKSGIRLAAVIDQLAEIYFARKAALKLANQEAIAEMKLEASTEPAPPVTAPPVASFNDPNRFDALFEGWGGIDELVDSDEELEEMEASAPLSSDDDITATSLKSEKTGTLKKSGKRNYLLEPSQYQNNLVLLKRFGNQYFMTSRALARKGYLPNLTESYMIMFKRRVIAAEDWNGNTEDFVNVPVKVSFDCAVFGLDRIPRRTITEALLALRHRKGNGANESVKFVQSSDQSGQQDVLVSNCLGAPEPNVSKEVMDKSMRPDLPLSTMEILAQRRLHCGEGDAAKFEQRATMTKKQLAAQITKAIKRVRKMKNNLLFILYHNMLMIVHMDTLRLPLDHIMQFNEFQNYDVKTGESLITLVDQSVYDFDMGDEFKQIVKELSTNPIYLKDSPNIVLDLRPTLKLELHMMQKFHFQPPNTNVEQMHQSLGKFFSYFARIPDSEQTFYHTCWWIVNPALVDITRTNPTIARKQQATLITHK